jgi:hypothetical protein
LAVCRTLFHISSGARQNCEKKSFQSVTKPYTSVLKAFAATRKMAMSWTLANTSGFSSGGHLGARSGGSLSPSSGSGGGSARTARLSDVTATPSASSDGSSGALALV